MTLELREPGRFDDLLNYRLQRLFAASGAPVIRLLEGRYGITRREWRLLATLGSRGPLSPSLLAEECHLDRPRASRAIGSLHVKGLIERDAQRGDARRAQVALTDRGSALYQELFQQVAAINVQLVECLDDSTLQIFQDAMHRLTASAIQLNMTLVQDVGADRQAGGARRPRAGETPYLAQMDTTPRTR